jgi:pimeloyl-ACP methyl ester carboxylesterase
MSNSHFTRRGALGVMAAAGTAGELTGVVHAQAARGTFVLIHGTFCGAWMWRRVADLLQSKGQRVFTVTLTGLGERSHLLSKDINLDTQITDVVNVVKWEDLRDVCLVAHSFGGWIGSGVLEQIGDRVSSIVWLDAYKPEDGQKPLDLTNEGFRKVVASSLDKGEPSFAPPLRGPIYPIWVNETDADYVIAKLTHSPSARICNRSSCPAHAIRWRRRPTSAPANFPIRHSTRLWRNARPTSPGPRWKWIAVTSSCSISPIGWPMCWCGPLDPCQC